MERTLGDVDVLDRVRLMLPGLPARGIAPAAVVLRRRDAREGGKSRSELLSGELLNVGGAVGGDNMLGNEGNRGLMYDSVEGGGGGGGGGDGLRAGGNQRCKESRARSDVTCL